MKYVYILLMIVAVSGCSPIKTTYDYDKQAAFGNYKTYKYTEEALKIPIQELNRDRMINAIDQELAAKGFTKSDSPDVLIDLRVKAVEKKDATATTSGGYGAGRYGYGGGFTTTHVNVNEYTEGTLFIDMVDKASEKLVWQGRGTKVLDENASAEKRDTNILSGIKAIFANYPPKTK